MRGSRGQDRDPPTGWVGLLSPAGDVNVIPVEQDTHSGQWRQAPGFRGARDCDGAHLAFRDEHVHATAERCLSAMRVSVGLAAVARPPSDFARREALATLRAEIEDDLRSELAPVVKRELLMEAREQALEERARLTKQCEEERERKTMAKLTMQEEDNGGPLATVTRAAKKAGQTVKEDGRDAAVRSLCRQIVGGARKGIVRFLREKKMAPSAQAIILDLFDSKHGTVVVGFMLGTFLPLLPGLSGRPVVDAAAKEFRVEAMSLGFDTMLDGLGEYLLPDILSGVMAVEKVTGATTEGDAPAT
jgi:hypothetical protein